MHSPYVMSPTPASPDEGTGELVFYLVAASGADPTLVSVIQSDGHRIQTCPSLDEAAQELNTPRGESKELSPEPAVVLIDWTRPEVEREKVLTWLANLMKSREVEVIIHGTELPRAELESKVFGGYYFLSDPLEPRQLSTILRAAVNDYRLKRTLAEKSERTKNTFRLMHKGEFHFRTYAEAELLALHIGNAFGGPDSTVGILELLVNAVEHGNLEISYAEKGRLLESGGLAAEMNRRLQLPEFSARIAKARFRRRRAAMEIEIEDEGPGFDFEPFLTLDRARLFESHGRGILMANAALDIHYFAPGNRVRVRLPLK